MKNEKSIYDKLLFPEIGEGGDYYTSKHFLRYSYTTSSFKGVHYKILVPNVVKPVSLEPKSVEGFENLYAIGCYQTVLESEYPFMEVDVAFENLSNEVNASDWMDDILSTLSEEIINRKDYNKVSGKYSDVLTVNNFDDEVIISRIRAFKNYDQEHKMAHIIMVKVSCSLEVYDALAVDMLHIVSGFELINDSKWHLAEELKSINIFTPDSVSFYYPASWLYSERFISEGFSYCSLFLKKEGETCGVIDSYFLSRGSDVTKEYIYQLIYNKLTEENYADIERIELRESRSLINRNVANLSIGDIEINDGKYNRCQLAILSGEVENCLFFIVGLLSSREVNFRTWAVGKRTIDIILNSLNNYSLEYEDYCYH
ncbi:MULTISPECIES: hypothetical protein [Enterobacterales]|uniref:hypothetical protein n=1 Tax=Enterobacterales TaxID=91347 RepID=UPI002EDA6AF3